MIQRRRGRIVEPRAPRSHQAPSPGAAPASTSRSAASQVLQDVDFTLRAGRGRRAARRQRRRQVHADQDHHRRPPTRPRASPVRRPAGDRPDRPAARARWASRRSSRNGPWRTSSRCGATSSWAARSAAASDSSTSARCAASPSELMRRVDGLHVRGADTRHAGDRASRAASVRASPSSARSTSRPTSSSSTSRPWACRSRRPRSCSHFVGGIRKAGKSAIFIDHNIFHVYSVRRPDRACSTADASPATSRPRATRSNELMDIMREVAEVGRYTERTLPTPCPALHPMSGTAREPRVDARHGRAAERPGRLRRHVVVPDRHHRRVPAAVAALFIVLAPANVPVGPRSTSRSPRRRPTSRSSRCR